jgi:hypothetical protein
VGLNAAQLMGVLLKQRDLATVGLMEADIRVKKKSVRRCQPLVDSVGRTEEEVVVV